MVEERTELEMAMELDEVMDLAPSEAGFLGKALKLLKTKQSLKEMDSKRLEKLWKKHVGDEQKNEDGDADEKNPDEADLDDDDFV